MSKTEPSGSIARQGSNAATYSPAPATFEQTILPDNHDRLLHAEQFVSLVGQTLLADLLNKIAHGGAVKIPESLATEGNTAFRNISSQDLLTTRLPQLMERIFKEQGVDTATASSLAALASTWLHDKYGVTDRAIFTLLTPGHSGSYQTPGEIRYRTIEPKLPAEFKPEEASSISHISEYLHRKWGGLATIASPDRIVFSEMALRDTLNGLTSIGYSRFLEVNAAYSTRGSRTLLAFNETEPKPSIIFCSFVSRDLLDHKLMQMRLAFGDSFSAVKVLSGTALRSWQVAELNVRKQLQLIPRDVIIDDIVLGYADTIRSQLTNRNAELIGSWTLQINPQDCFAQLSVYKVQSKSGTTRNVGVFHDVALRYFGRSVLPLIDPLLRRGVDRIIFAGSAGCLDRSIPHHGLIIPKTFHAESKDSGAPQPITLDNELHQLVPLGVSYSGRHLSVKSPLVESQSWVDNAREQKSITSVDVEGAKIAELIAEHNRGTGAGVRFASAYIVTDYPIGTRDTVDSDTGLHNPQFTAKADTKRTYAAVLNLLWGVPDRFAPSSHTRLISSFYSEELQRYRQTGNDVALGYIQADVEARLDVIDSYLAKDRWVSLGLVKSLRDIRRVLANDGIIALRPENLEHEEPILVPVPALPRATQRALMLQSLMRSATLNSGLVGYKPDVLSAETRKLSLENATNGVEYILERSLKPLKAREILELHRILTVGVLDRTRSGVIREFSYQCADGTEQRSSDMFQEYVDWLALNSPNPSLALEAYWRFEHLHPFSDSSGRVAELLAQHTMLRATQHPFLFPTRFDIDYILSLNRNGADAVFKREFAEATVKRSVVLSQWLGAHAGAHELASASYDAERALLAWHEADGAVTSLNLAFKSSRTFRLDRETREFLTEGETSPIETHDKEIIISTEIPYRQFSSVFSLRRR